MSGPQASKREIRKGYVDVPGGQLHYRGLDADNDDPPIVFFHRTPVTSASFERVMLELAGWRRMIAFDTPGFGESLWLDDNAGMADFVACFTTALDRLGIAACHVVGHHTGAHFAAELAVRHPTRVLSVMIDGAMVAAPAERSVPPAPPVPAELVDADGDYARNIWAFLRPYYTQFDPDCIHREYVGALGSTFTRQACMAVVRAHDLAAILGRITCPLLASAAEDDVFVAHLAEVERICPQAQLRVYGSAGIASPELQTAAFAGLVRDTVGLAGDDRVAQIP